MCECTCAHVMSEIFSFRAVGTHSPTDNHRVSKEGDIYMSYSPCAPDWISPLSL